MAVAPTIDTAFELARYLGVSDGHLRAVDLPTVQQLREEGQLSAEAMGVQDYTPWWVQE